jgi:ATP-dependent DNA ligase
VLDSEGRQNFRDLRAGRGNLHYAAFDALWIEGKDLRPLLLARRKQLLTRNDGKTRKRRSALAHPRPRFPFLVCRIK